MGHRLPFRKKRIGELARSIPNIKCGYFILALEVPYSSSHADTCLKAATRAYPGQVAGWSPRSMASVDYFFVIDRKNYRCRLLSSCLFNPFVVDATHRNRTRDRADSRTYQQHQMFIALLLVLTFAQNPRRDRRDTACITNSWVGWRQHAIGLSCTGIVSFE